MSSFCLPLYIYGHRGGEVGEVGERGEGRRGGRGREGEIQNPFIFKSRGILSVSWSTKVVDQTWSLTARLSMLDDSLCSFKGELLS